MLHQAHQVRQPRQVHQHDRDVGHPPGRTRDQAPTGGLGRTQQAQPGPMHQHTQRGEVMGIETGGHQQPIPQQVVRALGLAHPIHQRQRRAQQPHAEQRVHTHFLAVAHRAGKQRQQHTRQHGARRVDNCRARQMPRPTTTTPGIALMLRIDQMPSPNSSIQPRSKKKYNGGCTSWAA